MKFATIMQGALFITALGVTDTFAQKPEISVKAPLEKVAAVATQTKVTEIKSEKSGVSITQTEFLGGFPVPFQNSAIHGKPVRIEADGCRLFTQGKGFASLEKPFMNYTDGKYGRIHFLNGKKVAAKYLCETPIKNLSHARITLGIMDPLRGRCVFSVIVRSNGKWIPVSPRIIQGEYLINPRKIPRNYEAYLCYDFKFSKGSIPGEIDGIGILDESADFRFPHPRYAQIEAK